MKSALATILFLGLGLTGASAVADTAAEKLAAAGDAESGVQNAGRSAAEDLRK